MKIACNDLNHQAVKTLNLHWKQFVYFEKEEKPDLKWEIKQLLVSAFTQLLLSEWGAIRNMTTPAKAIGIIRENLITKVAYISLCHHSAQVWHASFFADIPLFKLPKGN